MNVITSVDPYSNNIKILKTMINGLGKIEDVTGLQMKDMLNDPNIIETDSPQKMKLVTDTTNYIMNMMKDISHATIYDEKIHQIIGKDLNSIGLDDNRALNMLKKYANVVTVKDLVLMTKESWNDLKKLSGFGTKTQASVIGFMTRNHLSFGMDLTPYTY